MLCEMMEGEGKMVEVMVGGTGSGGGRDGWKWERMEGLRAGGRR